MTKRSGNRPRDLNRLAASIVRDAVDEQPPEPEPEDLEAARRVRENGRLGGLKGGRARANSLSADERSEIAKKAARARWTGRG